MLLMLIAWYHLLRTTHLCRGSPSGKPWDPMTMERDMDNNNKRSSPLTHWQLSIVKAPRTPAPFRTSQTSPTTQLHLPRSSPKPNRSSSNSSYPSAKVRLTISLTQVWPDPDPLALSIITQTPTTMVLGVAITVALRRPRIQEAAF